jgi:hypothetical protein
VDKPFSMVCTLLNSALVQIVADASVSAAHSFPLLYRSLLISTSIQARFLLYFLMSVGSLAVPIVECSISFVSHDYSEGGIGES